MQAFNISLENGRLYEGCDITLSNKETLNLTTPFSEAVEIVKRNLDNIFPLQDNQKIIPEECVITGGAPIAIAMAIAVFLAQRFEKVTYRKGKKEVVRIT